MLNTKEIEARPAEQAKHPGIMAWITRHYTRQGLWSLFLMCAFPLHAWALILAFRDVSWVTDRTNSWDAVGVVAYALLFTLVESALLFAVMTLLGLLISTRWDVERRVAVLSVLAFLAAVWAMLEQLFFLSGRGLPGWFIDFLIQSGHPLRTLYIVLILLVSVTIAVPALLVLRTRRGLAVMRVLTDRLSLLTMFYLFLDVIGLVIVVIRNL
ncbi:MAG: hypothetical protein ACM3MF_09785 [Anaerolineae bacterium]